MVKVQTLILRPFRKTQGKQAQDKFLYYETA